MAAYNSFFPAGYQPAQIYYPPAQQNNQSSSIIWVNGEAEAKSYLIAPSTSVVLWDSEEPVIYIKSADASGMTSMKILDYITRENSPQTARSEAESDYLTKEDMEAIKEEIASLREKFEQIKKKEK